MNRLTDFILQNLPVGIVVFNDRLETVFRNAQADRFYRRFSPPEEIGALCERIFGAIRESRLQALFPGEIYLYKKLEGSTSNWIFRLLACEADTPYVCLFIMEESIANKQNINRIRHIYRLTRRETDVLRRVLGGLKNAEIAEELSLSEQTVKDHLSNVYQKTGTRNRLELLGFLLNAAEHISL